MKIKGKTLRVINPVKLLKVGWDALRMIAAYLRGEYPRFPLFTLIAAVVGAAYFLLPADALPDFLLGVGWLDDAAVLALLLNLISGDIEKFKQWEQGAQRVIDAEYEVVDNGETFRTSPAHRALK